MLDLDLAEPEHSAQRPAATRRWRPAPEALISMGIFAIFTVLVLVRKTALLEPDDYAYRAAIIALSHGHLFLTTAQYDALNRQLAGTAGQGIMQWHHLAKGWISEKNPGYPFFAVLFYLAGVLRLAPLFYGALACVALYFAGRAWIGRAGGVLVVAAYCFSGIALTFAWRDTMESFTDASLIAAGVGALVWVCVSLDSPARRRRVIGALGVLALCGATFTRYTDVGVLAIALPAVTLSARHTRIGRATLLTWWGISVAFAVFLLTFNAEVYGHATSTGYSAGEITFSLSSIGPNLAHMPEDLLRVLPVWTVGLASVIVMVAWKMRRRPGADRDLAVGLSLFGAWAVMWGLYFAYSWTVGMGGGGGGGGGVIHVVRFYLPAIGPIALLAAWLLARAWRPLALGVVVALFVSALFGYSAMATTSPGGFGGPGGLGRAGGFTTYGHAPNGAPPGPRSVTRHRGPRPTGPG